MTTVFFDIDSQFDFVLPSGALYVPGGERIIPAVSQLNRHAASKGIPLLSTMDAHAEDDPEFRQWPPHCVKGTLGQHKAGATLLDKHAVLPSHPAPIELAPQILVEKQALDCFTNVNLPGLLECLQANRFVVYGLVTEYCVRCAVLGLLRLGKPVEIVTDAIQTLNQESSRAALAEFAASGVALTSTAAICR